MAGINILNETHEAIHVAVFQRPEGAEPVAWHVVLVLAAMAGDEVDLPRRLRVAFSRAGDDQPALVDLDGSSARFEVEAGDDGRLAVVTHRGEAEPGSVQATNGLDEPVELRLLRRGRPTAGPVTLAPRSQISIANLERWHVAVVPAGADDGNPLPEAVVAGSREVEPGHRVTVTGSADEGHTLTAR